MFIRKIVVLLGSLGVLCGVARGGNVLYVDDDAPPAGDGLSWNTAYRFLQDALADAAGGGVAEIRVAQGVYTPAGNVSSCCTPHGGLGCDDGACETAVCAALPTCCVIAWDQVCADLAVDVCDPLCADPRTETFQLLNGVLIAGGYAGVGAPNPDARDIDMYETVLSGDLAGNDGPGPFENNGENSYTVVTGSGTDDSAVLDGVTVSGGNANGPDNGDLDWIRAGGMWNSGGSPTVINCRFQENRASNWGGAAHNFIGSDATFLDCVFVGNQSVNSAGAIYNRASNPTYSNCLFSFNSSGYGGALVFHEPGGTVTDCEFADNTADVGGGGIYNLPDSDPTVTDCAFSRNTADFGGGMYNNSSSPTVHRCVFEDNSALAMGGAIHSRAGSTPTVSGCTFRSNTASTYGGGLRDGAQSSSMLINCTFTGNSAGTAGGAISVGSDLEDSTGHTVISNCILWNNLAGLGHEIALIGLYPGSTMTVSYSDVEGGEADVFVQFGSILNWGPGNIDADPLLVDAEGRLSAGSPCIDAGDNAAVPPDSGDLDDDGDVLEPIPYDLDGNPRFVDDPCREDTGLGDPPIVDMGAYEFQDRSCDLDGSGDVGVTDFLQLLAAWGDCPDPCPPSCPADFDGDCEVGVTDFLILLANWG
jgi:predicted outer membrane repeat protein